jgi:threonyl-tRNA synthetase
MKLLSIHADHITYKTSRRAQSDVIEAEVKEPRTVNDSLVALLTIEKSDEFKKKSAAVDTVKHLEAIAGQVKTRSVVLFPFAHLSSDLASGEASVEVLDQIEDGLSGKGFSVDRIPFGWYKEWEIKNKGHPLSVLSRSY